MPQRSIFDRSALRRKQQNLVSILGGCEKSCAGGPEFAGVGRTLAGIAWKSGRIVIGLLLRRCGRRSIGQTARNCSSNCPRSVSSFTPTVLTEHDFSRLDIDEENAAPGDNVACPMVLCACLLCEQEQQ